MEEWEEKLFSEENVNKEDFEVFGESCGTACFLCLNEISHSLNTEGVSLIKIEDGHVQAAEVAPERFSLTPICRYLKLNTNQISILTEDVNLCQSCLLIGSKLSNLCLELELVQMKINHQLKTFTGILDGTTVNQLIEKNPVSDLKPLRDKLKQECHQNLKEVFPKVMLSRVVDLENPSFTEDPPELTIRMDPAIDSTSAPPISISWSNSNPIWKCPLCPSQYHHKRNLFAHQRLKHKLTPQTKRKNPSLTKLHKTCNLCNPPRIFLKSEQKRHQILCHIESLFAPLKLPHLTPPDFKIYVDHVLKLESTASKIVNSDGALSFKCPHCPISYQDWKGLRCHLFSGHREIIAQKITNLQKSSTVAEIKGLKAAAPKPPSKLYQKCTLCRPPCDVLTKNYKRHKICQHVESYFDDVKMPQLSPGEFKVYCEHAFKVEIISCSKIPGNDGPRRQCPHCPTTYSDDASFRRHLCLAHREILAGKIADIQKNFTVEEVGQLTSEARKSEIIKCGDCGAIFLHRLSLQRHRGICKLRPKEVGPNFGETGGPEVEGNWMEPQVQIPQEFMEENVLDEDPLSQESSDLVDQKVEIVTMILPD